MGDSFEKCKNFTRNLKLLLEDEQLPAKHAKSSLKIKEIGCVLKVCIGNLCFISQLKKQLEKQSKLSVEHSFNYHVYFPTFTLKKVNKVKEKAKDVNEKTVLK